jgi:hypothetical protein
MVTAEADPETFMDINLNSPEIRGNLSQTDYTRLADLQAAATGEMTPVPLDDLNRNIAPVLDTLRDTEARGEFRQTMIQWTRAFQSESGRPPNAIEQFMHAQMLSSDEAYVYQFNEPGIRNFTRGGSATLMQTFERADANGLESLIGTELTLNVPQPDGSQRQIDVTEDMMTGVVEQFEADYGYVPRPSQVIQILMLRHSRILP